jgi:hypothetical protein
MLSSSEVRWLLDALCVKLGFCLPHDAVARLQGQPPTDADEFTAAVFSAEGLDPTTADRKLYRQVRAAVAKAFQESDERASSGR